MSLCVCVYTLASLDAVLNVLVFDGLFVCRCSLMLLVIHSAMQLRSLSTSLCFCTTIQLLSQSKEETKWKMEMEKELVVELSERNWLEPLYIYISSAHLRTLFCNYVVQVAD